MTIKYSGSNRKNQIINGNFDIWQRGNSFNSAGTIYTADRWEFSVGDITPTALQQLFTIGQTEVPGNPKYFIRVGKSATSVVSQFRQKIEDVTLLSNKQVTLTLWAEKAVTWVLDVFQNFGTGGSPSSQIQTEVQTAFEIVETTANWNKLKVTFNLPSVSGKTLGTNGNDFLLIRIIESTTSTTDTKIAQVQLEEGSVATDFEQRHVEQELALCERYYVSGIGQFQLLTLYNSTTNLVRGITVQFPVEMRTNPTVVAGVISNSSGPTTDAISSQSFRQTATANSATSSTPMVNYTADAEL